MGDVFQRNEHKDKYHPVTPLLLALDADDTLWVNETYFREVENWYLDVMTETAVWLPRDEISRRLHKVILANIPDYGYGVKSFILSIVEATLVILDDKTPPQLLARIIEWGHEMLRRPPTLLNGVAETLAILAGHYRMVVVTKGDVLDQRRKLERSPLLDFSFEGFEVLPDKTCEQYRRCCLWERYGVAPRDVAMVGNSLRSDILPMLELGGWGIYIPFESVWAHEVAEVPTHHPRFVQLASFSELTTLLSHHPKT